MAIIKLNILKKALSLLDAKERKRAYKLTALTAIGSVVDVLGLASILPLILAAVEPTKVSDSSWWKWLERISGIENFDNLLLSLLLAVVLFFICKNLFAIWLQKKQAIFSFQQSARLTALGLKGVMKTPLIEFEQKESGELISRTLSVPDAFSRNILLGTALMISEIIVVSIILIALLVADPILLALLALSLSPVFYFFYRRNREKGKQLGIERQLLQEGALQKSIQLFTGFVDLKLSGEDEDLRNQIYDERIELGEKNTTMEVILLYPLRLIEIAAICGIAVLFIYGLKFSTDRSTLLAFLSIYATAAYRLMPSANRILNSAIKLKSFEYTIDIIKEFIETARRPDKVYKALTFNKNLGFKDLNYSYPNSPALFSNFNIEIKKGEITGLKGASGCGKSTLIKLLLGMYEAKSGKMLLDDKLIEQEEIHGLWPKTAYVGQEVFVLQESILRNVSFCPDEEADKAWAEECLKAVGLWSWVSELPKQIMSSSGESGNKMSGGQKQRLAIARALYRKAEILFLDEATASLDVDSEQRVLKTLVNLKAKGITIVMSSHRKSTLEIADIVIDLDAYKMNIPEKED